MLTFIMNRLRAFIQLPWFALTQSAVLTATVASITDIIVYRWAVDSAQDTEYGVAQLSGSFLMFTPLLSLCTGVLLVLVTAHLFKRIPMKEGPLTASGCLLLLLLAIKSQIAPGFISNYYGLYFVALGAFLTGWRHLRKQRS